MYRRRNLFVQFLLFIFTLGIYGIYWFYSTAKEMKTATGDDGDIVLWTILYIIPLANLFAYWKHAELVQLATDDELNKIGMFIAEIIFFPIYWIIVQTTLNSRSGLPPTQNAAP